MFGVIYNGWNVRWATNGLKDKLRNICFTVFNSFAVEELKTQNQTAKWHEVGIWMCVLIYTCIIYKTQAYGIVSVSYQQFVVLHLEAIDIFLKREG